MGKKEQLNYRQPSYFEQLKQIHKTRRTSFEASSNSTQNLEDSHRRISRHTFDVTAAINNWENLNINSVFKEPTKNNPMSLCSENLTQKDVERAWAKAKESCKTNARYLRRQMHTKGGTSKVEVKARNGWKTVRLFVSSTFHDFQSERDLLVKKVFPDLKSWCMQHKIYFVEIDLRWGVPQGADAEVALRTCLGEIERCYNDNGLPFFLNMVSERVGWVPSPHQVPPSIRNEFDWIDGLSITEMEVLHGALRSKNPNALFLKRHPSFLQNVPTDKKKFYQDGTEISTYKSSKFGEVIDSMLVSENQKMTYYARYDGTDSNGFPQLTGYEEMFSQQVLEFFKSQIIAQYPLGTDQGGEETTEWDKLTEMHETFMRNEAGEVGQLPVWDKQIADLLQYVDDNTTQVPYLLKAKSGSGKSSCLSSFITRLQKTIPDIKLFCHFIGAVPGSISYQQMVKRIANFLGEKVDPSVSFETITQSVCRKLTSSQGTTRIVIVIDAYDQLTEPSVTWLPFPLSASVKIVVTATPEGEGAKLIQQTYPKPLLSKELIPIDRAGKREMVTSILGNYNKKLDDQQMDLLLDKNSSSSYYWLSLACEELRIYGHFSKLTEKIISLPDDLVDLQVEILRRIEEDQPQDELLVATLCFLLISQSGLLEVELLELLAEPPNLLPPLLREGRYATKLPYKEWSEIMRDLRIFVKSMGDPSEGRLKIYHSTFAKAVEKLYFDSLGKEAAEENYRWFHNKLADYFKNCSIFERRLEEYPYHLSTLDRTSDLKDFLSEWDTIRNYYHPRASKHLSHLWSYVDPEYDEMVKCYVQKTQQTIDSGNSVIGADLLMLANICYQNGQYTGCKMIIEAIENAQESMAQLFDVDDLQVFAAQVKYVKVKNLRALHVKYVSVGEISSIDQEAGEKIESLLIETLSDLRQIEDFIHKQMCAELENRIGIFYMTKLFALQNSSHAFDQHDEAQLREKATEWTLRAQADYKELDNQIGVADTHISLALCAVSDEEKMRHFNKAEAIVGSDGSSTEHTAIGRLYMNLGIYYEQRNYLREAKENYEKYLQNSMRLFGKFHPETKRAQEAISRYI